ncbi:hypothetical protein AUP68_15562 [Ilyonectria robusta]
MVIIPSVNASAAQAWQSSPASQPIGRSDSATNRVHDTRRLRPVFVRPQVLAGPPARPETAPVRQYTPGAAQRPIVMASQAPGRGCSTCQRCIPRYSVRGSISPADAGGEIHASAGAQSHAATPPKIAPLAPSGAA